MRKLFTFLATVLLVAVVAAQAPKRMSYQAVIRKADNQLLVNSPAGMRISILQGSATGTAVFVETQTPTTNENGLVSIEIGNGSRVSGSMDIDWRNGPFYLQTETDPDGGINYSITGTSQLLSVPYSLYSEIGGFHVKKLHTQDELNLINTGVWGPNVPGSSTDIGDVQQYKGLILEWRMQTSRAEVFHQIIYLSQKDKDIITGVIPKPANYPRRYTTILADNFATMMWMGVSIQGTRLYMSTNSVANPTPRLMRIYAIL
jgi:hypothetical protein